ncbi:hypothetical protein Tco_0294690 [Tanacetum coccineum]
MQRWQAWDPRVLEALIAHHRVPFDQRNNPPQHPRIVYPPILDINYFCHFFDILQNYDPMDDEPMWAADHVVALTPGFAITILETANKFSIKEGSSNFGTDKIMARMDAMTIKMDAQYKELQSCAKQPTPDLDKDDMPILADKQSGRPFGSLSSNTQPNPQGNNSKSYQPPQSRNKHVNAVFTRSGKSYDSPVNPNDQENDYEIPINVDNDDKDDEPTP